MNKSATFYVGRDNEFTVTILSDGAAFDLAALTKVGIVFGGTEYDSDDYADAFDWTTGGTGEISFYLGKISTITEAAVDSKAEIILYSNDSPNGIVWDTIHLTGLVAE